MALCITCGNSTKYNGGYCLSCYNKINPASPDAFVEYIDNIFERFDEPEEEKIEEDQDNRFAMINSLKR